MAQQVTDPVADTRPAEQSLGRASAPVLGVRLKAPHEERGLVAEDCVQAQPNDAHARDEVVDGHGVVALRTEDTNGFLERRAFVKASGPTAWASEFFAHWFQLP
jgi:hypothetical protein